MTTACWECGAPAEHEHHVVPRSAGGTRTLPLCGACHGKVHDTVSLVTTSALTRAAMNRKRAAGECLGSVPYGMRIAADGVRLEVEPAEAAALAMASTLRAEGLSLRAIGARLTDAGAVPRGGAKWHPDTISRILAPGRV